MAGRVFVLLSILLTLLSGSDLTREITPEHAVVDRGLKLSIHQKEMLEERLATYNRKHKGEIAVIISDDLQHKKIAARAQELFEKWLSDPKVRAHSVLILLSPLIRKVRIQTGAQARKRLNDAALESILRYRMLFPLHKGAYYQGLHDGLEEIIDVLEGRRFFSVSSEKKSERGAVSTYLVQHEGIIFTGFFIAILAAFYWLAFDSKSKLKWALLLSLVLLFLVHIWITKAWIVFALFGLIVLTMIWLHFRPYGGDGVHDPVDIEMDDETMYTSDTDDSVHSDYSISTDADGAEGDF